MSTSRGTKDGAQRAKRRSFRRMFVVLAWAVLTYTILQTCVTPILPLLAERYGASPSSTAWVVTATLLAAAVLAPILGRLGDAKGKRQVLIAALVLAGLGCVLSAVASSLWMMLVGRVLQGAGAGAVPLAFGIIRDEFPYRSVPTAIGWLSALVGAGSAIGYVVTGPVVTLLGDTWIFWLPAASLFMASGLALVVVPRSPPTNALLPSLVNTAMFAFAFLAMLLAVTRGPGSGWASVSVVSLAALGCAAGACWLILDLRSEAPLVELRMLRVAIVLKTSLVATLLGFGLYATLAFVPQYLQGTDESGFGLRLSVTESSLVLVPLSLMFLAAGACFGWAERRLGEVRLLALGSCLSAGSLVALATFNDSVAQVGLLVTLFGMGVGLSFAALSGAVVRHVPQHQTAAASAMNVNLRLVGGAIGVAVTSTIVAAHRTPTSMFTEHGFTVAFIVLGGIVAVSVPVSLWPSRSERDGYQSIG